MLLCKNRSSSLKSAVRPVLEELESRQMLSATLTVVNPDAVAGTSRIVFNTIQNLDTSVPNVTHNQQAVEITDTGSSPLIISSIALSGPWSFVNAPAGGYSNVTVVPGTPLTVTLLFTQSTLPAHSYNETDYTNNTNGGAAITGAMTINSNDAVTPSSVTTLAGYWQVESNNNAEPSLQTLINLVYGYQNNINSTPIPDLTETSGVTYYGNEVASSYWEAADPTQRVHLQEIAGWHTEGNPASTSWYADAGASTPGAVKSLFTTPGNEAQSLFPTAKPTTNLAIANFNPSGAFGIVVDNEYSTDAINVANGNTGGGGHHFRFFPMVDQNGNIVPNTYIVAMDYGLLQDENYDFQDNIFILSNVRPVGTPATPTNLTATSGTAPVLSWTAVNYSPVSYDVYSSSSLNGTYKLLTTTAITTTTYTDTSSPTGTVYYHVTAVDTTQNPVAASAPASVVTNGGTANSPPVVQPYSGTAYSGQPVTFNPLVGATDVSGTINPATVVLGALDHGGSATVASSGLITYTPAAGFSGTETFTYTVSDSNSLTSAPATITFTDSTAVITAPLVDNYFTTTLAGTAVNIPVLSVDDAVTTFNTSSLVITSQTTHGTATVNSDGTVTYTPNATFIGGDTFSYTVADNNGKVSPTAIVDINVGVEISSAKGANRILTYPGTGGNLVTVTLSSGVADAYFDGSGTVASISKGKIAINGNSLRIRDLALSATSAKSTLSITSFHNSSVNLGGVTDSSPLGSFNAKTTTLAEGSTATAPSAVYVGSLGSLGSVGQITPFVTTATGAEEPTAGTMTLAGVRSVSLAGASSATITLGNTGVTATAVSISGAVTDTNLSSSVALTSLKVGSWTNTQNETTSVSAPSIGLLSAGAFQPNLTLTSTGAKTLGAATISGSLGSGFWDIDGGAGNLSVGATGTAWSGTFAALNGFTVRKGGLPSSMSATTIGTLNVTGNLTGDISATSAKSIKVSGAMTGAELDFSAGVGKVAALGTLSVAGAVTGSTLNSSGNVTSISVGSLTGSSILIDTTATTVANASAADIGGATLHAFSVKSKAASAFSDSNVIADVILSAATGQVNASNGGTPEGLAAVTFKSLAVGADGAIVQLPSKELTNNATLATYLSSKGATFGTFTIDIVPPVSG